VAVFSKKSGNYILLHSPVIASTFPIALALVALRLVVGDYILWYYESLRAVVRKVPAAVLVS